MSVRSTPISARHRSSAEPCSSFHRVPTFEPRTVNRTFTWPRPACRSSTHPCLTAVDILVRNARLDSRRRAGNSRRSVPALSNARRRFAQRSSDGMRSSPAPSFIYVRSSPPRTSQSNDGRIARAFIFCMVTRLRTTGHHTQRSGFSSGFRVDCGQLGNDWI